MRTASLRSGATPFGRISAVTAELTQRRGIQVPERAEVVAVHTDDDWFALFADEKAIAPLSPTGPTKPTETAVREAAPQIEAWELARFAPDEEPAWLKRVLNWRVVPWSAIATGIVLTAGVSLVVARSFVVDGTSAATEITDSSLLGETRTAVSTPVLTHSVAYAPPTPTPAATLAARKAATPTKIAPPPRIETRNKRGGEQSVTFVALSSARPAPPPKPTPIPATTPTPVSTPNPGSALSLTPAPPTAKIDASPSPVVAPAAPVAPSQPTDSVLIRSLLDHYRQAYSSLDANAVAAVWPSVNARSLARAFSQLESQRFEFTDCRIDVSVARAQASCVGRASFVPKIGGRTTRTESREWTFILQRFNEGWIISRAEAR